MKQAKARDFASEYRNISRTCPERFLEITALKYFAKFKRKYPWQNPFQ